MGSRKIEMKIVKDSSSRQATFSKRKAGLFKKANELAILCGAQVAIVAFSPGGKPYSFGSPSVQTVVHRFVSDQQSTSSELKRVNIKPVDEMNLDEVQEMKAALLELKEKIKRRAAEMEASSSDAKDKN